MTDNVKIHPLNVSYLVVGLIFLGLAGSWALREAGVIDLGEAQWLLPLTLVVAGAIGLLAFAAKGFRGRNSSDEPGEQDAYSYHDADSEGELR